MLNSITTETSILQASRHPIESVHFIFCDFDIFELVFPPTDFAIFSRLLIDISRRVEDRSGDMKYTFEIRNTH